ncbi:hypothetical protein [Foetidibacter luteolus]|uniref:hypothetical protein n=1 Tax=Foetidibacter luteolus TaxID=2608880 RepID=UPI00129ADF88|nr:hypothetical protein [Foetidibacter luteolus]
MSRKFIHITFLTVLLTSAAVVAMGSSSGTAEDKNKNKFSLKNLGKLSKQYSLSSLKYNTFQYKGTFEFPNQYGSIGTNGYNSMIRLETGKTTYIYPYKFKVKVPRFKTPTPPSFR